MLTVGDPVVVDVLMAPSGRRQRKRNNHVQQTGLKGRIVWVGPRFITVELDAGYRECFAPEQVRRVGTRRAG